jgi:hypothetical protein
VNAKTGWYPKLIFCRLLILGESLCNENVFDGLDFFLRNEYAADDCLLAAADGKASELLNATPPLKAAVSEAIEKVLSDQSKLVGAVLTNTLRPFAVSYFSAGNSGYLPLLNKTKEEGGDVFSASETALFVSGKRIGTLDKEETFAYSTIKNELKLANYTLTREENACTLSIKHNERKRKLHVSKDGNARLELHLTLTAGLLDTAKTINATDAGDVPNGAFAQAERQLRAQITGVFDKCRALGCELFEISSLLEKHENKRFEALQANVLQNATVSVGVRFRGVR